MKWGRNSLSLWLGFHPPPANPRLPGQQLLIRFAVFARYPRACVVVPLLQHQPKPDPSTLASRLRKRRQAPAPGGCGADGATRSAGSSRAAGAGSRSPAPEFSTEG